MRVGSSNSSPRVRPSRPSNLLTFLPSNIKTSIFLGMSYHIGWSTKYVGTGIITGSNLDYWFEGKPIGVRLYGHGHIIPGPGAEEGKPADSTTLDKGASNSKPSTVSFCFIKKLLLLLRNQYVQTIINLILTR